jgi:hypothetical protein
MNLGEHRPETRPIVFQLLKDARYRPDIVAAMWRLGRLATSDLSDVATAMLVAGIESDSLGILAGLRQGDLPTDGGDTLERAFGELDVTRTDARSAARVIARTACEAIVEGRVQPYAGAVLLWQLYSEDPGLTELRLFVGAASEIEDHPASSAFYEGEILRSAQELLSKRPPEDSPTADET